MYGKKNLNVHFNGDIMTISYERELDNCHKDIIRVNEDKYEELAKEVANQVKWIKGFKKFSVGFGHIDWYESCNEYPIPYFTCSEDGKRVKKGYTYSNDIPKDWTVYISLTLEIPSSVRGLNKFFEALRLNITERQLNDIRKAIKNKKYCSIEM